MKMRTFVHTFNILSSLGWRLSRNSFFVCISLETDSFRRRDSSFWAAKLYIWREMKAIYFHVVNRTKTRLSCYWNVYKTSKKIFREALSVLMLCTPVFIHVFTSCSSALLGCRHCGLSIWLSLLAIFSTLFWVYVKFFSQENGQNTQVRHLHKIRKGLRQSLGAQSINTERAFLSNVIELDYAESFSIAPT